MNRKFFAAIACTLMLSGCLSPGQQAAQDAQYAESVRARCLVGGYEPEKPELASCVQRTIEADHFARVRELDRSMRGDAIVWGNDWAFDRVRTEALLERYEWRRRHCRDDDDTVCDR